LDSSGGFFDLPGKSARLEALEAAAAAPEFWNSPETAQKLLKEQSDLRQAVDGHAALVAALEDQRVLLGLGLEEDDASVLGEVEQGMADLTQKIRALELTTVLSGEYDKGNAILCINAGAGGTESQDWAQMLLRMYLRWADKHGFDAEIVELSEGEVAGIKGATIHIKGEYAFGWLRTEIGVHRLVRKSPFDSGNRRHTSFTAVFVSPEIDDNIEIEINPADLRIDTYRASGAGGQHVNTTDSAVRITHLPTGIVVACQDERSQLQNKLRAMGVLRARLYDLELQKLTTERTDARRAQVGTGDRSEKIRTYNFPQSRITDHRIHYTTHRLEGVLGGDLDEIIDQLATADQAEKLRLSLEESIGGGNGR